MTTSRKRGFIALFIGLLIAALLAVAAALCLYVPGGARPLLGEGDLLAYCEEDGTISLTWSAETDAGYLLEVRSGGESYEERCAQSSTTLSGVSLPATVRIQAVATGKSLMGVQRELRSSNQLECEIPDLSGSGPTLSANLREGVVDLSWQAEDGLVYEVGTLLENGQYSALTPVEGGTATLSFSGRDGLEMPDVDRPLELVIRAGQQKENCLVFGPPSEPVTVQRNMLLGSELALAYEETEPRTYVLNWVETRGDYYLVQEWRNDSWQTIQRLTPSSGNASLELGLLASGSRHLYQVTAQDNDGTEHASEQVTFYAGISPLYCTVWPILDLAYYNAPSSGAAGKISAGTALCVLEESGNWFQVRWKDRYVYVDSRYCMINLAEYLGDYCAYDITNSYRSIFRVHNSPIAKVTNQVISGYENMRTAGGDYLVPYLYPCARKLLTAAKSAMADGYRLKIYESFRPNQATRYLYDTTAAQLNWPALTADAVDPVTGWRMDLATGLLTNSATGEKVRPEDLWAPLPKEEPKEEEKTDEPGAGEEPGAQEAPVEDPALTDIPESGESPEDLPEVPPEIPAEDNDTGGLPDETEAGLAEGTAAQTAVFYEPAGSYESYYKLMTRNGSYSLGSFLARVTSAHNRGIALDLTLETLEGGQELEMQSAMHDLSWYSATSRNNGNAKLLAKYMTGAGMNSLSSEWWHFQDDDTRAAINLNTYLSKGVDASGWTRDAQGWRYRNADGSFVTGRTITVDGKRWTLDGEGYASE